jgi:hypothetical protein
LLGYSPAAHDVCWSNWSLAKRRVRGLESSEHPCRNMLAALPILRVDSGGRTKAQETLQVSHRSTTRTPFRSPVDKPSERDSLAITRILGAVRLVARQSAAVCSDPTVNEVLQSPNQRMFVQGVRDPGTNDTGYGHADGFRTPVTFSVGRYGPSGCPAIFQTKAGTLGDTRLLVRDHPYATVVAVKRPRQRLEVPQYPYEPGAYSTPSVEYEQYGVGYSHR